MLLRRLVQRKELQWRVLQHAEAAYDFQAPRGKEEGKGGPKADARLTVAMIPFKELSSIVSKLPEFLDEANEGAKGVVVIHKQGSTLEKN